MAEGMRWKVINHFIENFFFWVSKVEGWREKGGKDRSSAEKGVFGREWICEGKNDCYIISKPENEGVSVC